MSPPTADVATADAGVPDEAEQEAPLMKHAYDGIREYDNPLPGWWRAIFWGSIVFAAVYWVWFHVAGWGKTPDENYRAALAGYEAKREQREAMDARNVSEDLLAQNAHNGNVVAHGAEIFAVRCASCHTADGRGLIGPNLTDLYQIHGTTRMDMFQTVKNGVPGTAMPAWGEQLAPSEVVAVVTFATTLRGQNLPGKPPQGQKVEPFR